MDFIIKDNYEDACAEAFKIINEVLKKGDVTLGLTTGSTLVGVYKLMIEDHLKNNTTYKNVKTFNLDEYVGLPRHNFESYDSYMKRNLFNHIDIDLNNVNIPRGDAPDLLKECARYNELLDNNTIDLMLLGIGANGHIGFNEPGTSFESTTYITNLTKKTINDNSRFFSSIDEVPTRAITMGIKNILKAKKIILLACGTNKAAAIQKLYSKEITENLPASALRNHNDVTIIVDKDAFCLV